MNYLDNYNILNFNVTWNCPVNCSYCHITSKASLKDTQFMTDEALISACEQTKKYNIREYRISGGEPTVLGEKLFEYADLVFERTNQKPFLLTSGYKIDEKWMKSAENKFAGIYISVENPLAPLQKVVPTEFTMGLVKNATESLPFRYGLTLIEAKQFKNIEKIFDILYENSEGKCLPQLDYPSLLSFVQPNGGQLRQIYENTKKLFSRYGIIPQYFPNLVGSILLFANNRKRVLVNFSPNGKFENYDDFEASFHNEVVWREFCLDQQKESDYCKSCDWVDVCKHHSGFWRGIRYDWCHTRKVIFKGMYEGISMKYGNEFEEISNLVSN